MKHFPPLALMLVTGLGGSSTCYATFNWKEIRQ